MEKLKGDVVVIGAGVTGTAVARELARYQVKVFLVESILMWLVVVPRPTQLLCMRVTTRRPELGKLNSMSGELRFTPRFVENWK